jgi:hypothetical protein
MSLCELWSEVVQVLGVPFIDAQLSHWAREFVAPWAQSSTHVADRVPLFQPFR